MANETKLAVILHADVVGSTAMVHRDERLAHERIRDAFRRFSEIAAQHGGRIHEVRGDALVAEFSRASDATLAATDFQASNSIENEAVDDEVLPVCRVGIALGEVIIADSTVTGSGVVLAQRLEQLAAPGGVCISAAIREALPERLSFEYEDLAEQMLKGFSRPQRAYAVRVPLPDAAPLHTTTSASGPIRVERVSIAVLPFRNLTSDAEQDFFADGLAEDLISALSRYRWFSVMSRSSSFAYRDGDLDARRVSKELGSRYIVQGSVRRAGARMRLAVELVDGALGAQLWSMRYDREVQDVFDLQDELTQTLTAQIAPELSNAEQTRALRSPPDSFDAWEHYLRGLWHLGQATGSDALEAERWLTRSIDLDRHFSPAYSARSHARQQSIVAGGEQDRGLLDNALADARAAVALDSQDPFAQYHLGRALRTDGRHEDATSALMRAIELNPSFAEAYNDMAITLQWWGRSEESYSHLERALALNPIGYAARTATMYIGFAHLNLNSRL